MASMKRIASYPIEWMILSLSFPVDNQKRFFKRKEDKNRRLQKYLFQERQIFERFPYTTAQNYHFTVRTPLWSQHWTICNIWTVSFITCQNLSRQEQKGYKEPF